MSSQGGTGYDGLEPHHVLKFMAELEAERKRRDTFLEMLKVEIKNKTLRKRIEAELENQGGK
jgi:hypothetical protein